MTITLTPDIEQALAEEAQETGKPLEQLAVERLRTSLALQDLQRKCRGQLWPNWRQWTVPRACKRLWEAWHTWVRVG